MAPIAVQGVWTVPECGRMIINRYQRAGSASVCLLWMHNTIIKMGIKLPKSILSATIYRHQKNTKLYTIVTHHRYRFRIEFGALEHDIAINFFKCTEILRDIVNSGTWHFEWKFYRSWRLINIFELVGTFFQCRRPKNTLVMCFLMTKIPPTM